MDRSAVEEAPLIHAVTDDSEDDVTLPQGVFQSKLEASLRPTQPGDSSGWPKSSFAGDADCGSLAWLTNLLSDRRTWAVLGAKGLTDMIWWFMLFWAPDLFTRVFKLSQAELGAPIALIYGMAALGSLSSGVLFPYLLARGLSANVARKTSMLFYSLLIIPIPLALKASSPWVAAGLIGLALFAHQGFATNVFSFTADTVPTKRVATVIAISGVFGNLSGMGIIEVTGWTLTHGVGYWPMFAVAAVAYLIATLWIHLLVPVIRPGPDS